MIVRYIDKNSDRFKFGSLLFVYAIDICHYTSGPEVHYYVTNPKLEYVTLVPEPVGAEKFEMIDDSIPNEWGVRAFAGLRNPSTMIGFPEMLQKNLYARLHDMTFDPRDAKVMKKYIDKYEEKYKDQLTETYNMSLRKKS